MNYSQRVGLGICLIGLALILFFISDLEFTALSSRYFHGISVSKFWSVYRDQIERWF